LNFKQIYIQLDKEYFILYNIQKAIGYYKLIFDNKKILKTYIYIQVFGGFHYDPYKFIISG
jgi:hypothetical protein